jgi:hypothetical protein
MRPKLGFPGFQDFPDLLACLALPMRMSTSMAICRHRREYTSRSTQAVRTMSKEIAGFTWNGKDPPNTIINTIKSRNITRIVVARTVITSKRGMITRIPST